jgi:DNA-binding transcriptional ArsR family regulator
VEARRPATDDEAKVLASALRLRILRACREPRTNRELAAILDRDPATVLHHVRRLVDTGFLAPQAVRRGTRGAREIPYLATGKSWQLSVPSGSGTVLETFLAEVALVPATEVQATWLGLRLAPADLAAFRERLYALVEQARQLPEDPDAPAWSLFLALHPDPDRP